LNNHQLWSRNIYDPELMILSMVPEINMNQIKTFFRFRCTKRKEKSF